MENVTTFVKANQGYIIAALLIFAFCIYKFDFNLTDFIADKVIQKLELKYSPYGPKAVEKEINVNDNDNSNPWR